MGRSRETSQDEGRAKGSLQEPTRPTHPARENGRKRDILAAAERLFSKAPYEAVSVRDVAAAAEVNSALIRYYFGSKDDLYRRLFSDRYHLITRRRVEALEAFDIVPGSRASVAGIVECWLRPLVELAASRESKHFAALLAREASDATMDRHSIVAEYLDPSAQICLQALRRALPDADEATIVHGYLWMIAAAMSTITASGRAQRLGAGAPASQRPNILLTRLVTFASSGLVALVPATAPGTTRN